MGLRQADSSHRQIRVLSAWLPVLVATGLAMVLALWGDSAREWLAFYRPEIAQGELWRLVSGHFVHLGVSHLLLNVAGLLLVWYLVGDSFGHGQWLLITLLVIIGIDAGLWFLEPQLIWYVGLSGMLHGLLAAGIVGAIRSGRVDIWVLAIGLLAKITYEQIAGPLPGSEQSSGGHVIVAAHAYGVVAGLLAGGIIMIRVRGRASI